MKRIRNYRRYKNFLSSWRDLNRKKTIEKLLDFFPKSMFSKPPLSHSYKHFLLFWNALFPVPCHVPNVFGSFPWSKNQIFSTLISMEHAQHMPAICWSHACALCMLEPTPMLASMSMPQILTMKMLNRQYNQNINT